jgi:hypothetical protein
MNDNSSFLLSSGAGSYMVLWDLPYHGLSGPFAEESICSGLWAASMQAIIEEFDLHEYERAKCAYPNTPSLSREMRNRQQITPPYHNPFLEAL